MAQNRNNRWDLTGGALQAPQMRSSRLGATSASVAVALASTVYLYAAPVLASEPPPEMGSTDVAPRTALEEAVQSLMQPVVRRLGVRSHQGSVDLWLFSSAGWEQVGEDMRAAVSARRTLAGKFTLDRWTYVEPDHSYVADVLGGSVPYKIRLTQHQKGALVEVIDAGEPADTPRWSPTWRQRPVLFTHGAMR